MNKNLVYFFLFSLIIQNSFASLPLTEEEIPKLWKKTVSIYLKDIFYTEDNAYDSSHVLMVPMAYAFENCLKQRADLRTEFHQAFVFLKEDTTKIQFINGQIESQFNYFLAKYVVYAAKCKETNIQTLTANNWLITRLKDHWELRTVLHWTQKDNLKGVKQSLDWKQKNSDARKSYYQAVVDEELFVMAAGAELFRAQKLLGLTPPPYLHDIVEYFSNTIVNYGKYTKNGGWLFQPGAWQDHPDFKYAQYDELKTSLTPVVTDNISWDSSHMHRMPLLLKSLQGALLLSDQPSAAENISKIRQAFKIQFERNVLIPSSQGFKAPRINNYMDGRNGLYRYGYATAGSNLGYGPYGLSAILLEGWYVFMGSKILQTEYQKLAFPLEKNVIKLFVGPNTTRKRHILVTWPDYFENGFSELYSLIASRLNTSSW